ncbi:hypothetical protein WH50_08710 [Pokkaliibacter plantistimulans]|uniref:TRAP transporter small permease protein n=1 Tax=Pokkaliibacter plantistimulans TaxID=1635171 RepID=A0ABX5LZL3_9GAMM|nr:TRAP transporter small permease [Pokkaliibacter plantistimulans]PXF31667.1 hypothetical protein WH50_08710 [Pokkaliibacter plantistimulans]
MFKLLQLSKGMSWLCLGFAGIALVGLMGVTVVDVITRWLYKLTSGGFGFTIVGSVEMVKYLLYFALLSAMAASVERGQVVVELFTQALPARVKALMGSCYLIGFTVLGAALAYGSWEEGFNSLEYGEVTQDLALPIGPVYFVAAIMFAVMAIRTLIHTLAGLAGVETGQEEQHEL